jgi:hypothetical protein
MSPRASGPVVVAVLTLVSSATNATAANGEENPDGGTDGGTAGLRPSAALSSEVRRSIRLEMTGHGREMTNLLWTVLLLDYSGASASAQRIAAASERLPHAKDGGARAELPERFVALQRELKTQLKGVQRATDQRSSRLLTEAFGRLSRTCVSCHAFYMYGPKEP